jgi:hypothetical protein
MLLNTTSHKRLCHLYLAAADYPGGGSPGLLAHSLDRGATPRHLVLARQLRDQPNPHSGRVRTQLGLIQSSPLATGSQHIKMVSAELRSGTRGRPPPKRCVLA